MIPFKQPKHIENYDHYTKIMRSIGTAGHCAIFNYANGQPQWIDHSMPALWSLEYMARQYTFHDPVIRWGSLANGQNIRWSEIKLSDPAGIMKRAQKHGLTFGASFSRKKNERHSLLSVARSDSEISDIEMQTLSDIFDTLTDIIDGGLNLTEVEIQTLRELANGETNQTAAINLGTSPNTIIARTKAIRRKLGARNATQAVGIAASFGIL